MSRIKGIFNLFKKPEYVEVVHPPNHNKKTGIITVLIFVGIVLLAFGGGGGKKEDNVATANYNETEICNRYIEENEKRLEEILSQVSGAGQVKVMITLEETGEKHLATDKKSDRKEQSGDDTVQEVKTENNVVTCGSGSEEKPFVVKENVPTPSGVLVVANGAGNEGVRLELYEAVRALYGISGHRIKITKGNLN